MRGFRESKRSRLGTLAVAPSAAVAALLLAGGVGYAASQIDGAQIKPNSIPYNRLTHKAQTRLRGKRGLRGPVGLRGPSDGYISAAGNISPYTTAPVLHLPKGSYMIEASVQVLSAGDNPNTFDAGGCHYVYTGATSHVDYPQDITVPDGHDGAFPMQGAATYPAAGGTVTMSCSGSPDVAFESSMTAVKVASVHDQTPPGP